MRQWAEEVDDKLGQMKLAVGSGQPDAARHMLDELLARADGVGFLYIILINTHKFRDKCDVRILLIPFFWFSVIKR